MPSGSAKAKRVPSGEKVGPALSNQRVASGSAGRLSWHLNVGAGTVSLLALGVPLALAMRSSTLWAPPVQSAASSSIEANLVPSREMARPSKPVAELPGSAAQG